MRGTIEAEGTKLAFVFMENRERAATFFAKYGVAGALQFSDPTQALYRAFELRRTSFLRMLWPPTVWRYIKASVFAGHGVSSSSTDMEQMPGGFLFHRGKIVKSFRHKTVADRPDYCELAAPQPRDA